MDKCCGSKQERLKTALWRSHERLIIVPMPLVAIGIPSAISSDNGSTFVQRTVKGVLEQLSKCVYHPQSQEMVERVNGTLKAKLNKICATAKMNWVDGLPLALMTYRMLANRNMHLTPHEMLMGRPITVPHLRGPYNGGNNYLIPS